MDHVACNLECLVAMDATACKEEGNAAMGRGDYVNAMKWYSQALALNPKEAALYSNRSFAFLRLGLTNRALTDASEAAKRRSDWSKAHFRLAEALSQAGLHQEALRSYELGCRCERSKWRNVSQLREVFVAWAWIARSGLEWPWTSERMQQKLDWRLVRY